MFTNASGNAVNTSPVLVQLDVPCEPVGDSDKAMAGINFLAVIMAVMQLIAALKSGDQAQIIAAIQALIKAITGV